MSLVSFRFFALTGVAVLVYYLLPLKYRWTAILASSLFFYYSLGSSALIPVICISVFSYIMGLVIEKSDESRKRKTLISIAVIVLLSILALVKLSGHFSTLSQYIIVPTGISYFSLSIIAYLLDVYWKKEKAERSPLRFLTFVLYFPKILQGPISRHKLLGEQLKEGKRFDWEQLCFGMQLVLWGLFKKIVIADRLSIAVSNVYSQLDTYREHGVVLAAAMIFSALQLYMDFSGYTDMAVGISQMFGIELEQNFNHPFFAESAAGFWQRWHMTLSGWFKDYLFLPVSRTEAVKKLSKKAGNRFGAAARKKTMMICSTAVVWIATGLWHGTGINYIVWGIYWGSLMIISQLAEGLFTKMKTALSIKEEAALWKLFRMFRTFLIFVFGKMISAQENMKNVAIILKSLFTKLHPGDVKMIAGLGMYGYDFAIVALGLILVLIVSVIQEKGVCIREQTAKWYAVPRWLFYCLAVTVILLIGLYGKGYDTSTFAYQFF
ncbi:MAG: hypothetical protein K6B44_09915 [Lachnospiraceae bacterium]|nr:hypothetical protein [Lachnospiraceae bacterium]